MDSDDTPIIRPITVFAIIFTLTFIIAGSYWLPFFSPFIPPEPIPTPVFDMSSERISIGAYSFEIVSIDLNEVPKNAVNWENVQIVVNPGIGISTSKPATKPVEVKDTITISGMAPGITYGIWLKFAYTGYPCYNTTIIAT